SRPRTGGQGVAGVSEIVEVDTRKPGFAHSGQPDAIAEVAVPQWLAFRAGEDQPFVAVLGEAGQVPLDDRDDDLGNRHDALASRRLRWPIHEPQAVDLAELPDHPD